jgi:allantoin racemase
MNIRVIEPIIQGQEIGNPDNHSQGRIKDALADTARIPANISIVYIKSGPEFIESEYEDALAVPGTVEAAIQAEKEGADAIVINCTADTGVKPCREAVNIPVVASMEPAMHLAAQLTHRFSVLSFLERVNHRFEDMAWKWGLYHKLASVRAVGIPVENIRDEPDYIVDRLFETGLQCVQEDGAHGLILGCTDFEYVSDPLKAKFDLAKVPVILFRPFLIGVYQAYELVSMGIAQSKLIYPRPKLL